jgi:hypothetical protein
MTRLLIPMSVVAAILVAVPLSAAGQPDVHVEPMDAVGPRPVEKQTQSSVVRDYLLAWKTLGNAMAQNRVDLVDAYFVGLAKGKLADTIRQQQKLGMHVRYRDKSHKIKVVFYSPEGLSIQLVDDVEYEVDVLYGGESLGSERVRARYIVVLTPAESKWKVRIFQGETSKT